MLKYSSEMGANSSTGVRDFGLGRHLWALKPEQVVGFEKVKTLCNHVDLD